MSDRNVPGLLAFVFIIIAVALGAVHSCAGQW